ncbi:MAG: CDP-alcohol phosphatidyltransferase family protein [Pseudohongiellaceae bacterium]
MADLLTTLRLLLIAPLALAMADPGFLPPWLVLLLLLIAIATDYFDGRVARALGRASPRGQLYDHATDFLLVTINLAALAYAGLISFLLPVLIIVAFSQYVVDSYWLYRQRELRMSFLGRWNGILYFGPLLLVATGRLLPDDGLLLGAAVILSQLLILSTLASIADRALAPMRNRQAGKG